MREEGPTNVATSRAEEGSYRNLEGIVAACSLQGDSKTSLEAPVLSSVEDSIRNL